MKKNSNNMHGWLIINKPEGPTSFDVIRQVRRLLGKVKCGHAGTLDPLASGVLPLAFGEATKVISWAMDKTKIYYFTLVWGEQRSTDDREGDIVAHSTIRPSLQDIQQILPQFCGTIQQIPPLYSAIKIAGKRACDRMRQNEDVQLQARGVLVHKIDIIDARYPHQTTFRVTCGKGVYIRSLARDMGLALGSRGYAAAIHRAQVGSFKEDCAIPLEKLALLAQIDVKQVEHVIRDYFQPLDTALDDIPAVQADEFVSQAIRHGQIITLDQVSHYKGQPSTHQNLLIYNQSNVLLAIAQLQNGVIRPKRVFNY